MVQYGIKKINLKERSLSKGYKFPDFMLNIVLDLEAEDLAAVLVGAIPLYEHGIIAMSASTICSLSEHVAVLSNWPGTILINGERGSGKESMARFIKENGPRQYTKLDKEELVIDRKHHKERLRKETDKERPFYAFNCASVPDTLFESEFFGYKKGSQSEAKQDKDGIVKIADNGVLLLDEISHLSKGGQGKLLRFLQEGEFWPLGAEEPEYADVQIYSATNRNLWEQVEKGDFLADLYDRLTGVQITVPPLENRGRPDKEALVMYFILEQMELLQLKELSMPEELFTLLISVPYAGNIREMKNRSTEAALNGYVSSGYYLLSNLQQVSVSSIIETIEEINRLRGSNKSTENIPQEMKKVIDEVRDKWANACILNFLKNLSPGTKKKTLGISPSETIPHNAVEIMRGMFFPEKYKEDENIAKSFFSNRREDQLPAWYFGNKNILPHETETVKEYSYKAFLEMDTFQEGKDKIIDQFEIDYLVEAFKRHNDRYEKDVAEKIGLSKGQLSILKDKHNLKFRT